jgi:hypothetical protein
LLWQKKTETEVDNKTTNLARKPIPREAKVVNAVIAKAQAAKPLSSKPVEKMINNAIHKVAKAYVVVINAVVEVAN